MSKLSVKFLFAVLALLIPSLSLFGVIAANQARQSLEAELGLRLEAVASTISADLSASRDAGRLARMQIDSNAVRSRMREWLLLLQSATDVERIRILNLAQKGLVDTDEVEPFSTYFDLETDRTEIENVFASAEPASSVLFYNEIGAPFKRGFAPIFFEEELIAIVAVEASAANLTILKAQQRQLFASGLMIILLFAFATIFVSKRIVRPITRLSKAASRIAEGNLNDPLVAKGNDEIAELAHNFELMRQALVAREEEMQLMLGGIAHEIRNPLAGMELFLGILEEDLISINASETASYAGRVRRELDYLKHVVNTFLTFARQPALEQHLFPAIMLFNDAISSTKALALEKSITIETEILPSSLQCSGDFSAIRGVLQNLIQNAIQASENGGIVSVQIKEEIQNKTKTRILSITDFGSGMSKETLSQIFRPFFTTREKGTGLGLPLANKLITKHKGSLSVTSELEKGSTFVITLPFDPNLPPIEQKEISSANIGSGMIGFGESDKNDDYDGEMIG